MTMVDVAVGEHKRVKRKSRSPSRRQLMQGQKYEQQCSKGMAVVGGYVHRMFDTHDNQIQVGKGLFEAVDKWENWVFSCTRMFPHVSNEIRQSLPYKELADARAAYKYVSNLMIQKQPSDYVWVHEGTTRWVEVKSTSNQMGIPIGNLKESQLRHGLEVVGNGGLHYYWVVGCPPRKTPWSYWVWTPDMFDLWSHNFQAHIIPWAMVERVGVKIPHLKGKAGTEYGAKWDFHPTLQFTLQSRL